MALQFKFVELSIVTDETLEESVNEWVGQGWHFEGVRFVTTEHSKRPSMAFVSFTREAAQVAADREPPRTPRPLVTPVAAPTAAEDLPLEDGLADQRPALVREDDDSPAVIVAAGGNDVE